MLVPIPAQPEPDVWQHAEPCLPIQPPVPVDEPPSLARRATGAAIRNGSVLLYAAIGLGGFIAGNPIVGAIGLLAALGVYTPRVVAAVSGDADVELRAARDRVGRMLRTGPWRRKPRIVRGPNTTICLAVRVETRSSAPGRRFDPSDPACQQLAARIHRLRSAHGLGIGAERYAGRQDITVTTLYGSVVGMSDDRLRERLNAWRAFEAELGAYDNPIAVWLAGIACAEPRRLRHIQEALEALRDRDAALGHRLLLWLERRGAWVARVACALARGEAWRMDLLLAEQPQDDDPGDVDARVVLVTDRWAIEPTPHRLESWVAVQPTARALARAQLPRDADGRWALLLDHADPTVAGDGLIGVLRRSPAGRDAVRALHRDDLRRRAEAVPADHPLVDAIHRVFDYLELHGEAGDLALLGRWRGSARFGAAASQSHAVLKERAGGGLPVGELSLADAPEQRGAVSLAVEETGRETALR